LKSISQRHDDKLNAWATRGVYYLCLGETAKENTPYSVKIIFPLFQTIKLTRPQCNSPTKAQENTKQLPKQWVFPLLPPRDRQQAKIVYKLSKIER